ncbi:hypothetical protein [Myxococcus sp. Y35]|uniref:hypothetical protein n=1 Tax=Pseudomyxococcus flavus TaxID=3115648 RepID=UPI003CEC6D02
MRWSLAVLAVLVMGCGAGSEAPVDVVPPPTAQAQSSDSSLHALSGATRWAQRLTGPSEEVAVDVAHDGDGNFFIAATFEGKLSDAKGKLGTSATRASVLAKYRPNGHRVWSRTVPAQVTALATNRARHVLVTGTFEGSIDLGGGPLTVGEFQEGVFLAAFDAGGRHVWSLAYPLEFFSFFGARKMLTDSNGNIAVTGLLRGAIYFGSGSVVADSAPVLLRFSPTGIYQWSYVESPFFGESGGVATDEDDNLYMAGTIITDLFPPMDVIPFVNKFSPAGTRLWQRQLDTTRGYAQSVGVHGNRVVVTGTFMSPLSFGGQTFFPQHSQDGFVVALTRANEERWAKQLGLAVLDISMDHRDDLVVVGKYEDGDDLGLGSLCGVPGSDTNLFAAKYDRVDGYPRWTRGFPMAHPPGVSTAMDRYRVSVDEAGSSVFLGGLIAPLDVGPKTLVPSGVRDLFLLGLKP